MTSQWPRWRLKSPASRLFTQSFILTQIKENIKVPHHWPLCGEFTGDRWIPRRNGQLRGKCFHLMTSSCNLNNRSILVGTYILITIIWDPTPPPPSVEFYCRICPSTTANWFVRVTLAFVRAKSCVSGFVLIAISKENREPSHRRPGDHFTKKRASFQSELAFSFTTVCRKLASLSKKLARFLRCFTKLLAFCDPENM